MSEQEIAAIRRRQGLIREIGEINAQLADPRVRDDVSTYDALVCRQHECHSELRRLRAFAPARRQRP